MKNAIKESYATNHKFITFFARYNNKHSVYAAQGIKQT